MGVPGQMGLGVDDMIEDFAKLIPKALLNRSGSVFYSGRRAFGSPSKLYILGVNPGGDPERQAEETASWHTNKVLRIEPERWSAYRDESWEGSLPGTRPMQRGVIHLLRCLRIDPGEVPASNIVFLRSGREDRLEGNLQQLARECWPFHQSVIEKLGTSVILGFGRSAGNWVCNRLNARTQVGEFVEDNRRQWRSRVFRNGDGFMVVVATHPSIADWTAPATDPTELVQTALRAQ